MVSRSHTLERSPLRQAPNYQQCIDKLLFSIGFYLYLVVDRALYGYIFYANMHQLGFL